MTSGRGLGRTGRMIRRALASSPILFSAVSLAACSGQDLAAQKPEITPPAFQPAVVAPPVATEGVVAKIAARADVPLSGPRVDAKPGDWMIQTATSVAVVSADGRVIDFGAKLGRDELVAIDPTAFFGLDSVHFEPERVEATPDGRAIHAVRRVLEQPLALHVFVTFQGERLRVETAVVATASVHKPIAVTLGERVYWGNVPTWAEGHGLVLRGEKIRPEFVAREAYGVAYALRPAEGRLFARFDYPDTGFFEPAVTGETPELVPPDRPTSRRAILLAHATSSLGGAVSALVDEPAQRVSPPPGLPRDARIEIARCATATKGGSLYARYAPGDREIALPEGCFQMRLAAPGHVTTPWFATSEAASRALAPSGSLRVAIHDKATGRALPGRVLVRGIHGTRDPDWGTDADRGASLNVIHSERGADERPIPPGKYHVVVGRGFEYTMVEEDIEVVAGKSAEVAATLSRVVDTRGFLSADLHLHAMPSPDAPQPLADRVRALVATGVEVGVATDHNKVTDYKPVIAELGVGAYVASVVGDEITTRDPSWGHFNAFPLPAGLDPLPYKEKTPTQIFAAARAAGTLGASTLVQVNHPRMGRIGYFELLHFDRDDIRGFTRRVAIADMGFDAIEVFNGDHYARIDKVEECMRDWYALLEAGYRVTATGNSDSHRLSFHEAGVPRNLVAVADDDPARFDEKAFIESVRKGRVVVSSGPFIRLTAGGKGVGDTIPAGGAVDIEIVVEAPPWVDVSKVELVRRGEVTDTWGPFEEPEKAPEKLPKKKGAKKPAAPKPAVPPSGPRRVVVKATRPLARGDWIIAIARGSKPMSYLHRSGAKPFAFTNPIWVE